MAEQPAITVDVHSPAVDVNAPLDARDTQLVQQTFAVVATLGADNVGIIVFKNIFQIAPEALGLFSFKDEADLYARGGKLEKHATKIVNTLAMAISLLGDLTALVPSLQELGLRHVGYKVLPEHYDVVGQAIIMAMEMALGDKFTDPVKNAYLKVWAIVKTTMVGDNYS